MTQPGTGEGAGLPLAGVRLADFSWIVAGPQCTRILADLGAEVIRIENESYIDSMRLGMQQPGAEPSVNGSGFFSNLNRNKKGMTANLHHPRGHEAVERLIATCDVVVENFSAGVFERLGFGWERLHELNPRVIYLSLSGYGHTGRDASYITWGPTAQAVSGVTEMSGLPSQPPAGWGFSYLDHTAGYFGAIAVLMALVRRGETGEGQRIDLSQIETGMVLGGVQMLDYQVNGRRYERIGNRSRWPSIAPHNTYRCRDSDAGTAGRGADRWIAIAVESDEQWAALCEVLGATDLASDGRFATNEGRVDAEEALDEALGRYTADLDAHELMYRLQAAGVPAGVTQHQRDKMEDDPQLAARGFYSTAPHAELGEHRFDGLPFRFSRSSWHVQHGAPLLGEHTREVLRGLGYADEEIDSLAAELAV
jgi:benzylsuccinate CoA-transferase BbsF subunit